MDYNEIDRELLREQRRIRNRQKRENKQQEKRLEKELQLKRDALSKRQNLVTQEFLEKFKNLNIQPDGNVSKLAKSDPLALSDFCNHSDVKYSSNRSPVIPPNKPQVERFKGKHREIIKVKKSNILKKEIQRDQEVNYVNESKRLNYATNLITYDLEQNVVQFLKKIVCFQQNAYNKDKFKAIVKPRYKIGLREVGKYFLSKEIKALIIASDLNIATTEDVLYKTTFNLVELAETNNVPVIFALKRRKLGTVMQKYRPVSCVGILSYDSANDELKKILDVLNLLDNTARENKNTE